MKLPTTSPCITSMVAPEAALHADYPLVDVWLLQAASDLCVHRFSEPRRLDQTLRRYAARCWLDAPGSGSETA